MRFSATAFGLTTMLLTNLPVRGSERTTLVIRSGRSVPAPNTTPAVKIANTSLKQKLRKMFSLFLDGYELETVNTFPKQGFDRNS